MITSLKPSSDGKALILRLYNTGPSAAQASLKWGAMPPKSVSVSDLSEAPGQQTDGAVDLAAYEVRTLRAELK
jgi:alpha-mannosidase